MITVEQAWSIISEQALPLPTVEVPLADAVGSITAVDVVSGTDLPPFSNSAMDGYAVCSADTLTATNASPVTLTVTHTIAAGSTPVEYLLSGTAHGIMTGAQLPDGADAVIPHERVSIVDNTIIVAAPTQPEAHVRHKGSDVVAGDTIMTAGTIVTPLNIGLLAAAGVTYIQSHRPPRVAVVTTGSELVRPGSRPYLPDGCIWETNSYIIQSLLESTTDVVTDLGIAGDDEQEIRAAITRGLDADVIVISGGVSVGAFDHVKTVLEDLGMERLFWRVNMKPGKPLLCGRIGETWIFGLPGNPISCAVGISVFVTPLLRILRGEKVHGPRTIRATLTDDIARTDGRQLYATAELCVDDSGRLLVTPTNRQGSSLMHTLTTCNGFVIVPAHEDMLPAGAVVDVITPVAHWLGSRVSVVA